MAVSILPRIISSQYEWSLAIVLPALKVANSWIYSMLVKKVPGANIRNLNFFICARVLLKFTNFIAIRISSFNEVTVYSLFVVDLVLHVHGCLKIVQLSNKVQDEGTPGGDEIKDLVAEKKSRIATLATSEFFEAFVPVAYGIGFATAYYGPNAELLRNVKSDYFGGTVLENLEEFYIPLCLMFGFDALGVLISAASLNYACNINLYQELCNLMKDWWIVFMIHLASISFNIGARDINFAMDLTMKFLWTTDEGRAILFRNSTQ